MTVITIITMMTKITITPMAVKDCIVSTARRFPLAIAFTFIFAIFALVLVWHPQLLTSPSKVNALAYLGEAILMSIAVKLWDERTGEKHILSHIAGQVVLIGVAIVWINIGALGQGLATAHLSIVISLLTACVFLPYARESDDLVAVNFSVHLTKQAIIAPVAGLIPTVVLCGLIFIFFPVFFGITAYEKDYLSVIVFFQIFLPMLLFLSRIYKGKRLTNKKICIDERFRKLMTYILLPAATCYICVLYCYECHIALAWELPNGGVSYLVAIMMGIFFLIEFYLFFINHDGIKPTSGWFMRWLPLLVMPLLILMSIGIGRRIYDHGLTASRLYLATLNVWFYVACIVMFYTRLRRISWIPVSFSLLFMLTSVFPINYNSIARDYILNDIQEKSRKAFEDRTTEELEDLYNREIYMKEYYQIDVKNEQQIANQSLSERDALRLQTPAGELPMEYQKLEKVVEMADSAEME